ncbi:hypothetical protein LSI01_06360 [Furfurilactobacillus siliginis]|uniref:Uncharacterized protein n=1 Tax=Furfurilactobacillus siliginis TaxID=348151 RepID=A0A510VTP2_9LACO|nr:hypothetical protein LSI01_06360 [Furfurilactobacillus siliginis]
MASDVAKVFLSCSVNKSFLSKKRKVWTRAFSFCATSFTMIVDTFRPAKTFTTFKWLFKVTFGRIETDDSKRR